MHGWVAFNASDMDWDLCVENCLCHMPRLRRVHLPTNASRVHTGKLMHFERVLESCTELSQLDVMVSHYYNASMLLMSPLSSRLTQLSLEFIGPDELDRLAQACPQLLRLHLHDCRLDDLDLTSALPAGLTVLTMEDCKGAVAPLPFESAQAHFGNLQMLYLGLPHEEPTLPTGPDRLPLLRAVCTQPSLLVLPNC